MIRSGLRVAAVAMTLVLPVAAEPARSAATIWHCPPKDLNRITRRFAARVKQKDLTVLDLFTPDAVLIGPAGSEFFGRSHLRKLFVHAFRTFDSDYHFRALRAFPSETGVCVQEGLFWERLRTEGKPRASLITGEYRFTYAKAGASWRFRSMEWTRYSPEE